MITAGPERNADPLGPRPSWRLWRWAATGAVGLLVVLMSLTAPAFADTGELAAAQSATGGGDGPSAPAHEATTEAQPAVAELCDDPGSHQDEWIDAVQRGVYFAVCGSASWVDGLFGLPRDHRDRPGTYGRLGLFQSWDDYNAFDTRLRLRARIPLPAFQERLQLLIGVGDEQALILDRDVEAAIPAPDSLRELVREDSWMVGINYTRIGPRNNGFDFGWGMRVRAPPDPYVKGSYRHHFVLNQNSLLRVQETLFWRNSRRFGTTTEVEVDRLLGPERLLRWENVGTIAGDSDGLQWASRIHLFQSLRDRSAMAFTIKAQGETGAEVGVQNYGIEFRFRRRLARPWLFLEVSPNLTWPRETELERRRATPGVTVGLEMYFGPVPDRQMH